MHLRRHLEMTTVVMVVMITAETMSAARTGRIIAVETVLLIGRPIEVGYCIERVDFMGFKAARLRCRME